MNDDNERTRREAPRLAVRMVVSVEPALDDAMNG